MDNNRMSTADMLQYCEEALAWQDFGPIDIFFFESVKKILLGQCSALEEPEDVIDDLMGIERPVRDVELEPEYGKYADIYYGEEGDDDIPDYSRSKEDEAFDSVLSGEGFFDQEASAEKQADTSAAGGKASPAAASGYTETSGGAYTLSDGSGFTQSNESAYTLNESTESVSTGENAGPDETDEVLAEIEAALKQSAAQAAAPAQTAPAPAKPAAPTAPSKPAAPPSVNITVGSETANMVESEFNDLKDTLAAAAAAAEKSMQKK